MSKQEFVKPKQRIVREDYNSVGFYKQIYTYANIYIVRLYV